MNKITGKTIIYFQLKLKTNLHIGSGESNIDSDALCIRNSQGHLIIPGTTLAGIFRSNLESIINHSEVIKKLFGDVEEKTNISLASNILFQDAFIQSNGEKINTDIRDGIKIDRQYLSTEEGAKYDKETVFKDSVFQGIITLNKTNKNNDNFNQFVNLVKIIFYMLDEGFIAIGGNSSRGLGFCSVEECLEYRLDFTDSQQLNEFLLYDFYDCKKVKNELKKYLEDFDFKLPLNQNQRPPISKNHMIIKISFLIKAIEPLLINGPRTNDEDVDLNFVKTGMEGRNKCYIPGSSVKGPARNRAEMILRTLEVDPGGELVDCLFGSTKRKSKIQFYDLFPAGEITMKYFDHNRIDRFTGGTIENALFNEKVVFNGIFYGNIIIHEPKWKELKLLIQLFKDLYLADIRIGYGKTKGYGKIRGEIKDIKIYSIQEPRIEEENLSDYGFEFTQSENIYQICLIENIYLPEKLRKYDKFLKKVDGCNYV